MRSLVRGRDVLVALPFVLGIGWWLYVARLIELETKADKLLVAAMAERVANDVVHRVRNTQAILEVNHATFNLVGEKLSADELARVAKTMNAEGKYFDHPDFDGPDYISYGSGAGQYVSIDLVHLGTGRSVFLRDPDTTGTVLYRFPYSDQTADLKFDPSTGSERTVHGISAERQPLSPYEPRQRDWYVRAISSPGTEPVVTPPFVYATQANAGFNISRVARTSAGTVGVHTASINQQSLSKHLKSCVAIASRPSLRAAILLQEGTDNPYLVGDSEPSENYKQIALLGPSSTNLFALAFRAAPIESTVGADVFLTVDGKDHQRFAASRALTDRFRVHAILLAPRRMRTNEFVTAAIADAISIIASVFAVIAIVSRRRLRA
jgi:hypothetical protein